ncbi:MAG: hypothetical protein MUF84_05200 [Anaerolineae bacterium]|nr:hypothetical protein [Anaerolineae bacterium]
MFHLATVSSDGAISATLATEVGMWATPRFSPDGEQLLYGRAIVPYQSATSAYALQVVDRDGSNQTMIHPQQSHGGLDAPEWAWSPDGAAVAYIELGDVLILEPDAGVARVLTNEGGATLLRWR